MARPRTPEPYPGAFDAPMPSRAIVVGDVVRTTFVPSKPCRVEGFGSHGDAILRWADSTISEVPVSFLRLVEAA